MTSGVVGVPTVRDSVNEVVKIQQKKKVYVYF